MKLFYLIVILICVISCSNEQKDSKINLSKKEALAEIAKEVEILYSDSAIVKVRIISPTMKRYNVKNESYDEFPDGLLVEFLDERKRVTSWLEADYAIRKDKEKKIYVENNVVLYNKRDDKLETEALIWDEGSEEIYTSRPVKISQPERGDTSYGHGFRADQEFTRFEIKKKFSAIKNVEDFTKDLKG